MPPVIIHLHTIYQQQTESGLINKIEIPFNPGLTVENIIDKLSLKITEESTLIVVNGKIVEPVYQVKSGDDVHFIPAISGGCYGYSGEM